MRLRKFIPAVCIAFIIAVQTAFSAAADYTDRSEECFAYFAWDGADFWGGLGDSNADWAAYCRARLYGSDGSGDYAAGLQSRAEELAQSVADGSFVKPTDLQRTGIFLSALGRDCSEMVRLGVTENTQLDRQGFNAYIWALIALNVTGEEPAEGAVNTEQSLTEYIIGKQHDDGSFSLFGDGGDVDITSAAVYALCGSDIPGAQESAQRGADWLCGFDEYSTMGVRNCESTAQAVMALTAAGRAEKAAEAASQLEEYRRDGGYAHLPDGEVNRMATAQALEAFAALELSERGEQLFGRLADTPGGTDPAEHSVDSAPETGEHSAEAAGEQSGEFTGTHIKMIVSAVCGAAAVVVLVVAIVSRRKRYIPAAVLFAALGGGVWLLDIRTPGEYYAQSVTGGMQVAFSADCSAVLDRMDSIDPSVNPPEVIPADGVVIQECSLSLPEGSSAFDALVAAARQQQVRVDYTGTSWGTYVRSIGHICEFGFGELSGWMYRVNGEFPQVSAGDFTLCDGDVVEFVYTCALGRDVGDVFTAETAG